MAPHFKFETATLTAGFFPVEIYHFPSVGRTCGIFKYRRVSKCTVELEKNLVSKDPLVGSSQEFPNNLLSLRVLRRIFVGSVDKKKSASAIACQGRSVRADQAAGLVRSQVPGHLGADAMLEPADGRTAQRTKDAVHGPLVVTQAVQYVLDSQPVRFGHTGLVGHGRHQRG